MQPRKKGAPHKGWKSSAKSILANHKDDLSGAELGRWCYENPNLAAMTIEGLRTGAVTTHKSKDPQPVAWEFELANYRRPDGTYTGWCPRLDWHKPNVPPESIRNLRPLYAR